MGKIQCFKDYGIQNNNDKYDFILIDKSKCDDIHISLVDKIEQYLKQYNLHIGWKDIIPKINEMSIQELTHIEAEYLSSLLFNPNLCLGFVEKNGIVDIIKEDKQNDYKDMVITIEALIEKWKKRLYVIRIY